MNDNMVPLLKQFMAESILGLGDRNMSNVLVLNGEGEGVLESVDFEEFKSSQDLPTRTYAAGKDFDNFLFAKPLKESLSHTLMGVRGRNKDELVKYLQHIKTILSGEVLSEWAAHSECYVKRQDIETLIPQRVEFLLGVLQSL